MKLGFPVDSDHSSWHLRFECFALCMEGDQYQALGGEISGMRILVVSDLHGDLDAACRAVARFGPNVVLSCGDWGDPEQVGEERMRALIEAVTVYTTFGNHDPIELLARLRNLDDSPVLVPSGAAIEFQGLRIAAIGGIWAKSHAKPHYVTDADVAGFATRIAQAGPVDILISHGCPIGLADVTPSGRHGGQRCFLEAFQTVAPRLHLCGHLHVAQQYDLHDGRKVINVGATSAGSVVVAEYCSGDRTIQARLEELPGQ